MCGESTAEAGILSIGERVAATATRLQFARAMVVSSTIVVSEGVDEPPASPYWRFRRLSWSRKTSRIGMKCCAHVHDVASELVSASRKNPGAAADLAALAPAKEHFDPGQETMNRPKRRIDIYASSRSARN